MMTEEMKETPKYSDAVHKVLRGLRRDLPKYTEDDYKTAPKTGRVCTGVRPIFSKPVIRFCPKYGAIYMRKIMGRTLDFLDLDTQQITRSYQMNAYDGFWNIVEIPYNPLLRKEVKLELDRSEIGSSKSCEANSDKVQISQNGQVKSEHEQIYNPFVPRTGGTNPSVLSMSLDKEQQYPTKSKLALLSTHDDHGDKARTLGASGDTSTLIDSNYEQIQTKKNVDNNHVKAELGHLDIPLNDSHSDTSNTRDKEHQYQIKAKLSLLPTPGRLPNGNNAHTPWVIRDSNSSPQQAKLLQLDISWVSNDDIDESSKNLSNALPSASIESLGAYSGPPITQNLVEQTESLKVESENYASVAIEKMDQNPSRPHLSDQAKPEKSQDDISYSPIRRTVRNSAKDQLKADILQIDQSSDDIIHTKILEANYSTDVYKTAPRVSTIDYSNPIVRREKVDQNLRPELEHEIHTLIKDYIPDEPKHMDKSNQYQVEPKLAELDTDETSGDVSSEALKDSLEASVLKIDISSVSNNDDVSMLPRNDSTDDNKTKLFTTPEEPATVHFDISVIQGNIEQNQVGVKHEIDIKDSMSEASIAMSIQCPTKSNVALLEMPIDGQSCTPKTIRESAKSPLHAHLEEIDMTSLYDDTNATADDKLRTTSGEALAVYSDLSVTKDYVEQKQSLDVMSNNDTLMEDSISEIESPVNVSSGNPEDTDERCDSMINSVSLNGSDSLINNDILINSESFICILGIYARGQQHYHVDFAKDGHDDDDDDDDSMSGIFGVYTRDS